MPLFDFVVVGTPVSASGSGDAKRFWQKRVADAAKEAVREWRPSRVEEIVLRIAYFYVNDPAADLDNIIKPLQDALKNIEFVDDIQVIDLVASMRPTSIGESLPRAVRDRFTAESDFVYVAVDRTSLMEVFR